MLYSDYFFIFNNLYTYLGSMTKYCSSYPRKHIFFYIADYQIID